MTETTREERDELRRVVPKQLSERHSLIAESALDDADTLAHIEPQILYRDESMPEWAKYWQKFKNEGTFFSGLDEVCGTFRNGYAPDYRPDEDGPITLAIIEPPNSGEGDGE